MTLTKLLARFKGTVSRDFLLLVLFTNQFPPSPRVFLEDRFEFFRKFTDIFAAQGLPPVSTTQGELGAKFATGDIDTDGKFAAGVIDTGGNLPPVSKSPTNLPPVTTPVVHLDLQISPRIFEKIRNDPYVIIRGLGEGDS